MDFLIHKSSISPHHHKKSDFVEMGKDMLLLFAWQVSTVPRSSRCNGPT